MVSGTPIVVLVPRVIEIVWFRKTLTMTRMASVPMPAATPESRAIGAAVIKGEGSREAGSSERPLDGPELGREDPRLEEPRHLEVR